MEISMKIEMPPGEVFDRLAILFVKKIFLKGSPNLREENEYFYTNFKKDVLLGMNGRQKVKKGIIFSTFLKFIRLHKKSWVIRDKMEIATDKRDAELYFKLCREAHDYNLERRRLKNILNEEMGFNFRETSNFKDFIHEK